MIAEKVHISELIGSRFDTSFVLYRHKILKYKYPVTPLFNYLEVKPQYGAGEAGVPRVDSATPRYIRITDIDENGFLSTDLGVTANTVEAKYILNNNDILIARSGNTVGKSYIHKTNIVHEKCFFAGYLIRFVIDSKKIMPDYVYIFTKLSPYRDWVKVTQRVTGQPNINAEEYGSLPIPIPSIEVQQDIVRMYTQAIEQRQKKIYEAVRLLDGISDYLEERLHINTNNRSENSSSCNSFRVSISSLIGKRLDVSSNKGKFELKSSVYPNEKLSSVVELDPIIRFTQYDKNMPISFIPMECIDERYGEIAEYRETTVSDAKGYTRFEEGDLLWAKISPCMQNGKSAIARNLKNGVGCGSTEYFVMRPKDSSVLIDYVYILLRHRDVLNAAQSAFGGSAGQQRVSSQYMKSIMLPLPDYATQKSIADEVYARKRKAKRLQEAGDALLDEEKQKIENLILK